MKSSPLLVISLFMIATMAHAQDISGLIPVTNPIIEISVGDSAAVDNASGPLTLVIKTFGSNNNGPGKIACIDPAKDSNSKSYISTDHGQMYSMASFDSCKSIEKSLIATRDVHVKTFLKLDTTSADAEFDGKVLSAVQRVDASAK